jgi:hypothetical protein
MLAEALQSRLPSNSCKVQVRIGLVQGLNPLDKRYFCTSALTSPGCSGFVQRRVKLRIVHKIDHPCSSRVLTLRHLAILFGHDFGIDVCNDRSSLVGGPAGDGWLHPSFSSLAPAEIAYVPRAAWQRGQIDSRNILNIQ